MSPFVRPTYQVSAAPAERTRGRRLLQTVVGQHVSDCGTTKARPRELMHRRAMPFAAHRFTLGAPQPRAVTRPASESEKLSAETAGARQRRRRQGLVPRDRLLARRGLRPTRQDPRPRPVGAPATTSAAAVKSSPPRRFPATRSQIASRSRRATRFRSTASPPPQCSPTSTAATTSRIGSAPTFPLA